MPSADRFGSAAIACAIVLDARSACVQVVCSADTPATFIRASSAAVEATAFPCRVTKRSISAEPTVTTLAELAMIVLLRRGPFVPGKLQAIPKWYDRLGGF